MKIIELEFPNISMSSGRFSGKDAMEKKLEV